VQGLEQLIDRLQKRTIRPDLNRRKFVPETLTKICTLELSLACPSKL